LWDESAKAGFADFLPAGHPFPQIDLDRWQARLEDSAMTMLLAEEDGELLGFTACGESRDPDAGATAGEVQTFFVAPGHWRRGVGRALMDAAIEDLRERGYGEATVWSFAANDRANAFYEAQGFVRDGAERSQDTWAFTTEVRYRRSLP
jgi:GNAT superfamily N-acetyltransferase